MKHLFTAMLLLIASFATAQIVNIPDSNFKNSLIISGVDTNHDREIQQSEAEAIIDLALDDYLITDFTGIKAFINMKIFIIDLISNSASMDVSGLLKLETLQIYHAHELEMRSIIKIFMFMKAFIPVKSVIK